MAERRRARRIPRLAGPGAPRETPNDILDVVQLPRALDSRVRCQDLLDESRSGAWQANNEDRSGIADADARTRSKEVSAKKPGDACRSALESLNIKRGIQAAQSVPACVMPKGFSMSVALL